MKNQILLLLVCGLSSLFAFPMPVSAQPLDSGSIPAQFDLISSDLSVERVPMDLGFYHPIALSSQEVIEMKHGDLTTIGEEWQMKLTDKARSWCIATGHLDLSRFSIVQRVTHQNFSAHTVTPSNTIQMEDFNLERFPVSLLPQNAGEKLLTGATGFLGATFVGTEVIYVQGAALLGTSIAGAIPGIVLIGGLLGTPTAVQGGLYFRHKSQEAAEADFAYPIFFENIECTRALSADDPIFR